MNTPSGYLMDLLSFHNMIPKVNERKHAKKKVSGGPGSNSLVFSNEEWNKEDQISQFYPMQKIEITGSLWLIMSYDDSHLENSTSRNVWESYEREKK